VLRVEIIEDHPVMAEGLRALLSDESDIEVVGVAAGVAEAVELAHATQPDVILTDFRLADGTGAEALLLIRQVLPDVVAIFLSAHDSDAVVAAAVEAGASGYLLKTEPPELVLSAIRGAAAGEILVPARRLAELLAHRGRVNRDLEVRRRTIEAITTRELETLRLMASGRDNAAIARELHIAYTTVRSHVRSVVAKLEAHSRLEAVVKAAELGMI
jgi:DNA-binding NarL/FixJ family response regulator